MSNQTDYPYHILVETPYAIRGILEYDAEGLTDEQRLELFKLRIKAQYERTPRGYRRYIDSQKWRTRRNRLLTMLGYKCGVCEREDEQLHVHHLTYVNFKREWVDDVIVLCWGCHAYVYPDSTLAIDYVSSKYKNELGLLVEELEVAGE